MLAMTSFVIPESEDPLEEDPMGRGAWWATVHSVAKSRTCLKLFSMSAGMTGL